MGTSQIVKKIRRSVVAVATTITLVGSGGGLALADPIQPQQPTPFWSGLDATHYKGAIPNKPGVLLKEVRLDKRAWQPAARDASRILYTTRDALGNMAVSTAAIFLPHKPAPKGGYKVIAWAHGTVGLNNDCTPSAGDRYPRDVRYLDHWLKQGYAIVATDYVGLGTPGIMPYLDGKTSAQNVVDSVKAAQHSGFAKLSPRWVVVGQSQGGGVAMVTARYATQYSRGSNLDYRGAVSTGTPAYIEDLVQFAGPNFKLPAKFAGLTTYVLYILTGFQAARPTINIDSVLSPTGKKWVKKAQTLCYGALHKSIEDNQISVSEFFSKSMDTIPGIHDALREYMGVPVTGYDRPIFMGHGGRDTDVITPLTLRLVVEMKLAGEPLEFHFYPTYDHSQTVNGSLKDSTPFVARVMK